MKHLWEKLFPKQYKGPQFLTTQGINYRLECMIKEAKESIFIISPYIRINSRLKELLLSQRGAGITITTVFREEFTDNDIATNSFCRKNLHAKCYMTESAALIASLNIFDFSQINNDEMGIYIQKEQFTELYDDISKEVCRLCANFSHKKITDSNQTSLQIPTHIELKKGHTYSTQDMKTLFAFVDEYPSGIKLTHNGNIVLFCKNSSKYRNEERDGVLYFQGQNTGGSEQKLIYGNKILHDFYREKKDASSYSKKGYFVASRSFAWNHFRRATSGISL